MMNKIFIVFGTRPEAIKMAPLYLEFKNSQEDYEVKLCVTGQHREMLDQVLELFEIKPDFDLDIMKASQSLNQITGLVVSGSEKFNFLDDNKKLILVTGHRRENFGDGFQEICKALKESAQNNQDIQIVYPVHLNPSVQEPVHSILNDVSNIFLIEPLEYLAFVYLMNKAFIILTDSGGIQEEAPSLGKPVLVMRTNTERPEAVKSGTVKLVGTNSEIIVKEIEVLLREPEKYLLMSNANNPYGDGNASKNIVKLLSKHKAKKNE